MPPSPAQQAAVATPADNGINSNSSAPNNDKSNNSSFSSSSSSSLHHPPHQHHEQQQQHRHQPKYHALVLDSGAIIKQTSFYNNSNSSSSYSLLHVANSYYTVPAVLSEIRDAKSRQHLEQFQLRLHALHNTTLQTRTPSKEGLRAISEFARKTGDYSQLSSVDLQVLSLLYDLELEACQLYNDGRMEHVRKEPKRVLGVCVQALNGGGRSNCNIKSNNRGSNGDNTMAQDGKDDDANSMSTNAELNGIIDAEHVDIEYDNDDDDDDDDDRSSNLPNKHQEKSLMNGTLSCSSRNSQTPVVPISSPPQPKSWAQLVNPQKAAALTATAATTTTTTTVPPPIVNYPTVPTSVTEDDSQKQSCKTKFHSEGSPTADGVNMNLAASSNNDVGADGQFDDASSYDDQSHDSDSTDDESNAINIANAPSDDEFSDEECDVFILEPHEAIYFKKLKDNMRNAGGVQHQSRGLEKQVVSLQEAADTHGGDDDGGLESEFPSLTVAAAVPYEGSDDEKEDDTGASGNKYIGVPKTDAHRLSWQEEEQERKKKSLQPMINGRLVKNEKRVMYNSFRRHGHLFSASGAAEATAKHMKEDQSKEYSSESLNGNIGMLGRNDINEFGGGKSSTGNDNREYKSRILGSANIMAGSSNEADFTSEMTAEDDDGEGWVKCAIDIHSMKAKGLLSLTNSSSCQDTTKNSNRKDPGREVGPSFQRAACATTDFAMQNVILQMNLELLSVDGVRVRRLKTWVTRCGACFTIYGSNDSKGKGGGRLFCDKCGSNALQRIAASVDRNTGRLKLHMKKNYQYNTRGTKFSLPKPGKVSDLINMIMTMKLSRFRVLCLMITSLSLLQRMISIAGK